MNGTQQYHRIHLTAKGIVYIAYLTLGTISIENDTPYLSLLFGTQIWMFGVNSVAYLIESMIGQYHRHNKL